MDITTSTKTDSTTTIQNYPIGRKAQNELRKLLQSTKDPTATISNFQQQNSLHTYLAKAFDTSPQEDVSAVTLSKKRTTRGEIQEKKENESKGVVTESFQPESVLTFCNYLGVSRYDMHKTISDSLRSALENEIDKVDLSKNKQALLDLLKSSWQFLNVPELRLVFVTLMKKLGDQTPAEVLVLLATKSKKAGKELKYGDLLNTFGLDMKRLVWETDWDTAVRVDGVPCDAASSSEVGTLNGTNILVDVIRPSVEKYLHDEALRIAADLAYTGSTLEKRVDTQKRRAVTTAEKTGGSSTGGASLTAKMSALTKTDKAEGSGSAAQNNVEKKNATGLALSSLKEVMGSRPKLLAAVLNILIAEHGRNSRRENNDALTKLVGGSAFLNCTLLADVLLSYGQLPRQYEHVRLLAQTLDKCVKIGIISDQAVAQIQECLRSIFQPDQDQVVVSVKKEKTPEPAPPPAPKKKNDDDAPIAVKDEAAERQFELKLLRKIIKAAVTALKENDPQGLFLNPVSDDIAPGYSRVIKNPMCIRTVEEKAVNLRYSKIGRYEIDVQLMFQNCIRYNIGKEGQWFRGEAKRQLKKWKDEVLSQSKEFYNTEMSKRKMQLDNAAGTSSSSSSAVDAQVQTMEEQKRKDILATQQRILLGSKSTGSEKRKHDSIAKGSSGGVAKKEVQPLGESKTKKRKKDTNFPSMPSMASMLLSDPFVVRLLFDKILRAVKNDVMKSKNIPAEHGTIPSILQLIHIANLSTKVCAMKGKIFIVPDAGFVVNANSEEEEGDVNISESFAVLRNQVPKLATLLLSADIDKRIAVGDLQILPPLPESTSEEWQELQGQGGILLDLVEGALVHLVQQNGSNEVAFLSQCPRFFLAISELSRGDMAGERCFFVSLTQGLLRYKKLPHGIRDMIVKAWLGWFKSEDGSSMTGAVHLCFVNLLNEWASLGNLVLPIDNMLSWSEAAVKAAEANAEDESLTFAHYWNENDDDFVPIKTQYERMLKGIPEDRRLKWKEAVGIDSL